MTRRRTFTHEGWIVSVVPETEVRQVRWPQEAAEVVRSAEREGGTDLLFDILGPWGPLAPVSRAELRQLVAKEVLEHSVLLRQPLRAAVGYARPQAVDLRDLIEPALLGSDTAEPTPSQSAVEPDPWIEFELVDTRGRAVSHFRATLNSDSAPKETDPQSGVVRHELSATTPVSVTLHAAPGSPKK